MGFSPPPRSDVGLMHGRQIGSQVSPKFGNALLSALDNAKAKSPAGCPMAPGLALSKGAEWIIEKHRGVISVHSEPGMGSTFRVVMPEA